MINKLNVDFIAKKLNKKRVVINHSKKFAEAVLIWTKKRIKLALKNIRL